VTAARAAWPAALAGVDPARLVFLGESGAKTNMARLRGRCPAGERLAAAVPHGHWSTTTMISAVRLDGPFAAATLAGATDADAFLVYARDVLAPRLRPGDVVVMDNLPAHKRPGVRAAVEEAGAVVLYLPPYSPVLNPIESMWSKVKAHLRAAAARTLDALGDAIDAALAAATRDDCVGFFRGCGYAATRKRKLL
jgi:transposase